MIVGSVGGGQLARMLALAGTPLGLRFVFLDPADDACAAPLGEHLCAAYDDRDALARLATLADCVTFEFENVPADSLVNELAERVPLYPAPAALAVAQDRLSEKHLFHRLNIPTAPFAKVDCRADLDRAASEIGFPAVLKTRRLGYDGKGQTVLRIAGDLDKAWQIQGGTPLILEAFVPFDREISLLAARGRSGQVVYYPLSENTHSDGILRQSLSRPGDALQALAEDFTRRLLDDLDYVGVLALECFDVGGQLLANELAPRVHNSGHWTIEGAETSQFENHLRAILNLPLGATTPVGRCAMVNLIGTLPEAARVLTRPGAHLHVYGKRPRPGRKLGHVTLRAADERSMQNELRLLLGLVTESLNSSATNSSRRGGAEVSGEVRRFS